MIQLEDLMGSGREGAEELDLSALSSAEREHVIRLLLDDLREGTHDQRIARALADLGVTEAVPLLAAAARRPDLAGLAAALAWWALAADAAVGPALVRILADSVPMGPRLVAAAELRQFPGAETERALAAALDDEDELVRGQATFTLLGLAGVDLVAGTPTFRLAQLILDPEPAVRAPAISAFVAALA